MKVARAHLYAIPPSAVAAYAQVLELFITDLIAWIELIREGLGTDSYRVFRKTRVQKTAYGLWLKDSTGYEVLLHYWTDEHGRRQFLAFAMHGTLPEPLEILTLSNWVLEGGRDVPLFVHAWLPGPGEELSNEWRLQSGEALRLDPAFPLQKWLEAIQIELSEPQP